MTVRPDVYRLLKSELIHELYIRGLDSAGTVADLRAKLTTAFRDDVRAKRDICATLNSKEELAVCSDKLDELSALVEACNVADANEVKRLQHRCCHYYNRLYRQSYEDDDEEQRVSLQSKFSALIKTIESYLPLAHVTPPVQLNDLLPGNDLPSAMQLQPHNVDPKLYKWKITYSGDDDRSLMSFLADGSFFFM
ncbi:hypothetical protein GE061_001797 [Apolygus lucorum]|uniref:Uncharacterized protein n=1 Tax=Apolygus lucorum TaxID=248454 RepID=A0A6A4JBS6_APOLU|nr:hypothetical protein GE061_001797 [Apolygus lucorum]